MLLQAPWQGGEFQYRHELRSDSAPNFDGITRLLRGEDSEVATLRLGAGDLNVFKGKNTAHRVTPPVGKLARVVTVFSYYETPGRMFSTNTSAVSISLCKASLPSSDFRSSTIERLLRLSEAK